MEIYKDIDIVDLGLYIKKHKCLIISDLQIGLEENLTKRGFLVPKRQLSLIKNRLEKIFSIVRPDTVIVNGDLKHEFGGINRQEWKETLEVIDYIMENSRKLILIKGNHDIVLGPIAKKRAISLVEYYKIKDIIVLHGHKLILNSLNSNLIIIGHEHPAVSLKEDAKLEKYKCFLKGKYDKKTVIVMPSFNMLNEGSNVLNGEMMSPFLKRGVDDFEVFVVEDKVYRFGKIRNMK